MQQRRGVQLGTKHGGDVVVGHLAEQNRSAREGRQVNSLKGRQVRPKTVEQCAHRGGVGRVGSHFDEVRPSRCEAVGQLLQGARFPGHRDDRFGPHPRELSDQMRSDVAGSPDDKLAGLRLEFHFPPPAPMTRCPAPSSTSA